MLLASYHFFVEAQNQTYSTTDLFVITVYVQSYNDTEINQNQLSKALNQGLKKVMTQFERFFGSYTPVQPGQSVQLSRRMMSKGIDVDDYDDDYAERVDSSGDVEQEMTEQAAAEDGQQIEEGLKEQEKESPVSPFVPFEQERDLLTFQTCPKSCKNKYNALCVRLCGYKTGRRRSLRQRNLANFKFNFSKCLVAMNRSLKSIHSRFGIDIFATLEVQQ